MYSFIPANFGLSHETKSTHEARQAAYHKHASLVPVYLGDSVHAELAGTRRDETELFVHCNGMTGCSSTTFPKGQCILEGNG